MALARTAKESVTLRRTLLYTLMELLVVLMVSALAGAEQVDIAHDISRILRHHNNERRHRDLNAANMREMRWDDQLALEASRFAESCRYARPSSRFGSNLYFYRTQSFSPAAAKRLVNTALQSWSRGKQQYSYSTSCGRACSYVQMINAQSDRIGCAVSNCNNLRIGSRTQYGASLFVCLYAPPVDIFNSFPYREGSACSDCPSDTFCKDDLCAAYGDEPVNEVTDYQWNRERERARERERDFRPQPFEALEQRDGLAREEVESLGRSHNLMREANDLQDMRWDPYLERWAKHVIRCEADYPGPRYVYTNFHRLNRDGVLYDVPYEWAKEGQNTNLRFDHGCRTPNDLTRCNHFTNLIKDTNTAMACAAKRCPQNTRQLLCLYDNRNGRNDARSESFSRLVNRRPQPYRREDSYDYNTDEYRRRQEEEQRLRAQEDLRRKLERQRRRRRRNKENKENKEKVDEENAEENAEENTIRYLKLW